MGGLCSSGDVRTELVIYILIRKIIFANSRAAYGAATKLLRPSDDASGHRWMKFDQLEGFEAAFWAMKYRKVREEVRKTER